MRAVIVRGFLFANIRLAILSGSARLIKLLAGKHLGGKWKNERYADEGNQLGKWWRRRGGS